MNHRQLLAHAHVSWLKAQGLWFKAQGSWLLVRKRNTMPPSRGPLAPLDIFSTHHSLAFNYHIPAICYDLIGAWLELHYSLCLWPSVSSPTSHVHDLHLWLSACVPSLLQWIRSLGRISGKTQCPVQRDPHPRTHHSNYLRSNGKHEKHVTNFKKLLLHE